MMKKGIKVEMEKDYINKNDKLLGEIDRIRVRDDMNIEDKNPKEIISYYSEKIRGLRMGCLVWSWPYRPSGIMLTGFIPTFTPLDNDIYVKGNLLSNYAGI